MKYLSLFTGFLLTSLFAYANPDVINKTTSADIELTANDMDEDLPSDNTVQKTGRDETIERPRTILLECFTSSTCGPCRPGNENLTSVLDEYQGDYALIKYQMNWPGNGDPYYTTEAGIKRMLYLVSSVPHLRIEGSGMGLNPTTLKSSQLTKFQDTPAFMELDVYFYVDGKTVYAVAKIMPTIDFPGQDLRLFLAIVEKTTTQNRFTSPDQSNGETLFHQVMKKFMPGPSGTVLGDLTAFTPVVISEKWEFMGKYRKPNNAASNIINHNIEHSVEDFNNLTVVAWVQNMGNKSVNQAANGIDTKQFALTFGAGANGSVSAIFNGEQINSGTPFNSGDEITLTASPNEGYLVKEWLINGIPAKQNPSNELTVVFGDSYLDVTVMFDISHIVTYSTANSFGTLTATVDGMEINENGTVLSGSKVTFTATPDDGYEVKLWNLNGTDILDNITNEFVIQELTDDVSVIVEFQEKAGINSRVMSDIKLYPNPTKGKLTVYSGKLTVESVEIFDITGRLVETLRAPSVQHEQVNYSIIQLINNSFVIDISHLSNGIYYLKAYGQIVKIVKN